MKYTQEQKEILRIGACFMGAWIALGLFMFGDLIILMLDLVIIMSGSFAAGYLFGQKK